MLPSRVLSGRVRATIAATVGLVVAYHLFVGYLVPRITTDVYRIDLDVYRTGGLVWAIGAPLYDLSFPATASGEHLPFTYTPLAAVLFSGLTAVPPALASWLWTAVSIALVIAVALLTLRVLGHRATGPARWWLAAAVPVLLLLEPVRGTLGYGQINILLLAAVCADALLPRTRWPRGLLVGLVAAVKLTPLVFVLWFLVRGDRRAAVVSGVSALGFTAFGFLLAPGDSLRYWTSTLFDTGRIGAPWYAGNQSLNAVIMRLGFTGVEARAVWCVAAAAVMVLAAVAARRAVRAGAPVLGLTLVAFGGLLASPVSWSHHWVWCVPALIALWHLGRDGGAAAPRRWAAGGLVLFVVAPQWVVAFLDGGGPERGWNALQQVAASGFVLWAVALLVAAVLGVERWGAARLDRPSAPARVAVAASVG